MTVFAKDIMVTDFDTIRADEPIGKAIEKIVHGKTRGTGYKTQSLMVVDDLHKLVGIVTNYDILYHLRPDLLNYGISGEELQWEGRLQEFIKNLKSKTVRQVMSTILIGASPEEHVMVVLDRLIKHRIRRLPVLENERPVGIVYLADVHHYLFTTYGGL